MREEAESKSERGTELDSEQHGHREAGRRGPARGQGRDEAAHHHLLHPRRSRRRRQPLQTLQLSLAELRLRQHVSEPEQPEPRLEDGQSESIKPATKLEGRERECVVARLALARRALALAPSSWGQRLEAPGHLPDPATRRQPEPQPWQLGRQCVQSHWQRATE